MAKILEPHERDAGERREPQARAENGSIWEAIDEIVQGVPDKALRRLPQDGAEQHDHYLYGSPKKASRDS